MIQFSAATILPAIELYLHASAVAWDGEGLLFLGAPGSGKTSRVLEKIAQGGTLIADDRVKLSQQNDSVLLSAPTPLRGLLLHQERLYRLPFNTAPLCHMLCCDGRPIPDYILEWLGHEAAREAL